MREASSAKRSVIILARAGRQLAAAARRAGYAPLVADLFGDSDTRALAARWVQVEADAGFSFNEGSLADALHQLQCEAPDAPVVWGSGFEDRAPLLAAFAGQCALLGTDPIAVAAFARPVQLEAQLRSLGIPTPAVHVGPVPPPGRWLRKQRGGSGGAHVSEARKEGEDTYPIGDTHRLPPGDGGIGDTHLSHPIEDTHYLQAYCEGRSLSVAAVVGAKEIAVLGFAEHLFWADEETPWRYGGAVGKPALPAKLRAELTEALRLLATHCGLQGLCGADFILDAAGGWQLVDINPRPTATFDLLADPGDVFLAHLAACSDRVMPRISRLRNAHAHAIYYAPSALGPVKPLDWPRWISDRPPAGTHLPQGAPVCTVRAAGGDADSALSQLHQRLHRLQGLLGVADRCLPNPRTPPSTKGARP